MQEQYKLNTTQFEKLIIRNTPLSQCIALKKRRFELEFIGAFLSGIAEPEKYQKQIQSAYSASFLSQRFSHIDFTRS
jgi:hypothetical protein